MWHGRDKIAYLCMSTHTFIWGSCPAFTTSVYAYVCEVASPFNPSYPFR